MSCHQCRGELQEVSLNQALECTQQEAFRKHIGGQDNDRLSDSYKQYHIRSYLKNLSLFLDYDLYKNRLRHGPRLKRFFIAPVNLCSILNLPWFLFNVITSNLFHTEYTSFCRRCNTKVIPGRHGITECDYDIEYFHILDDILDGRILSTKHIYAQFSKEKIAKGLKSAYRDLFCRKIRVEIFWDLLSIGFSIGVWIYSAVNVSYPMFQVLIQKLQQMEAYEWTFLSLR